MTIKALVQWGMEELIAFDSPRLEAELLLAHVLGVDMTFILMHDDQRLPYLKAESYRRLVKKRKMSMPLAYIVGHKEFYGLDFEVNENVLIPRPDTELLVESVLNYVQSSHMLLDVGTGSGCIPVAVLRHQPEMIAVATDVSRQALKVAACNIQKYGLSDRIQLIHSDLMKSVPLKIFERQSVIVTANLPYVPPQYQVNEEAHFEPGLALYAEKNGVDLYQKLLDQLMPLAPQAIFLECYEFQLAILANHLKHYRLKTTHNLLGEARMLMLERI